RAAADLPLPRVTRRVAGPSSVGRCRSTPACSRRAYPENLSLPVVAYSDNPTGFIEQILPGYKRGVKVLHTACRKTPVCRTGREGVFYRDGITREPCGDFRLWHATPRPEVRTSRPACVAVKGAHRAVSLRRFGTRGAGPYRHP